MFKKYYLYIPLLLITFLIPPLQASEEKYQDENNIGKTSPHNILKTSTRNKDIESSCITVTKDNKYVIVSDWYDMIYIWNLNSGKQLSYSPLKNHTYGVISVTITNDNQYI